MLKIRSRSNKCLAEAGFTLRKWATNSDELAKLIKLNESDNADDEKYVKDSLGNRRIEKSWVLIGTQLRKICI